MKKVNVEKVNVLEAYVNVENLLYIRNFNNENCTLAAVTDENCNIGYELFNDDFSKILSVLCKIVHNEDDVIVDVDTEIVLMYSVKLSDEERNKYYELIKQQIEKLKSFIVLDKRNLTFIKGEYTMA